MRHRSPLPLALRAVVSVLVTGAALACSPGSDGPTCVPDLGGAPSVARAWNEANLDAVRRDFPSPTVHARNLWHTSAAMWDAWAAYDDEAVGYFVDEQATADDVVEARQTAISYAAYRVLSHRYADTSGSEESLARFDEIMADLCLDPDDDTTEGGGPVALGNRIAQRIIEFGLTDGSLEAEDYVDDSYESLNPPLDPRLPGVEMDDPNHWQPLDLDQAIGQNGVPLEDGVQAYVGSQWGQVASFALPDPGVDALPIDPGPPPRLGDPATDQAFKDEAVEVLALSAALDPRQADTIDISPASQGDNTVGTNDGDGYPQNPSTGEPYAPNPANEADFARVLAEFWADGPSSETPPGHWNALANYVADQPDAPDRIGGEGEPVDRLEWDVKMYFALNGALHDAAVAAWGVKRFYDSARPVSIVRFLGQSGQSSDPTDTATYSAEGLPLVPGLVEVATAATVAGGGRHESADARPGEIVVRTWTGDPTATGEGLGGVDWIRAVTWVPYQLPTFVTPSFPGYVSGHSTFSRAGAEVLTELTDDPYFPGGLGEVTVAAGDLEAEVGPTAPVTLQWATYADAADQAGISRLYGGIHVRADDLAGRVMGRDIGREAVAAALGYFDGTAEPVPAG